MQLTRCCFVFLVQGSLYLVSGPRGAARRAGARRTGGERGKLPSPETFSLPPNIPEIEKRLEAGGEGGSEAGEGTQRVNRGGERVLVWPTHSAAGSGRCDQHEGKTGSQVAKGYLTPSRRLGRLTGAWGWVVKLVTSRVGGLGFFPDLGNPEGPGLWVPQRAEPVQAGSAPASLAPAPSRSRPPRLLFSSPLPAARSPSPTGPGQAAPAPGARGS